jgi:hypothetical protein
MLSCSILSISLYDISEFTVTLPTNSKNELDLHYLSGCKSVVKFSCFLQSIISSHASFFFCSNVVIRYVTVLAPSDSPNTDGIDPGNTRFRDLYDPFHSNNRYMQ